MKLAILEAGRPPGDLAHEFGDYPAMFVALLGSEFEVESFDVEKGELPHPDAHEAYLITGSPAGVYDPFPWIEPLRWFIRSAKSSKMVGVCFGHQIMVQAFGGHVEKSNKGWGVGLHSYPIIRHETWMDDVPIVSAPASHQDQVVQPPPGAELIASSVFTPYAGFSWRDGKAISFQFHPEMSPGFAAALYDGRRDRIEGVDAAIASLAAPNDNQRVGDWINRFLSAPQTL